MQPFLHEFAAEEKTQSSHDLHEGLNTKEQAAIVDVIYHGKFDKKTKWTLPLPETGR